MTLAAPIASAATITVNNNGDTSVDNGCTLRDAITAANTDSTVNGCMAGDDDNDTIVFNGVSSITLGGTALPIITDDLVIGQGPNTGVTIDANQMSRIFINRADLTLNGLTLTNGRALAANGNDDDGSDADDRSGGAVLNDDGGVLTVNGGSMTNNTSDRAGGAIEEASGADDDTVAVTLNGVNFSGNNAGANPGNGGVLHVTGTGDIEVNNGTFSSNVAAEGGALWNNGGTMTIDSARFDSNRTNGADANQGGGALFGQEGANGTINVTSSVFVSNVAGSADDSDSSASGGAILMGEGSTLNVAGSAFRNNVARRAGGAIEVRGATQTTLDSVSASGNNAGMNPGNGGVLHVSGDGDVDVSGGVYRNNTAQQGGVFWNNAGDMTLTGVSMIGNEAAGDAAAQGGGAIYGHTSGGTITLTDSRILRNRASGTSGSGGGILMNTTSTLNMTGGQIAANTANRAGGGIENAGATVTLNQVSLGGVDSDFANDAGNNPGNGGGLHIGADGSTTVTRSSVGYNTAVEGGGLWNSGAGTLVVDTSTVSNNTATRGAGVYLDGAGGTIDLDFASVTNNNGAGVFAVEGAGDSISIDNSLISGNSPNLGMGVTASDGDGNITGMVAFNGGFRVYGGQTATQPLASDSAALDVNDACGDSDDDIDQRGADRPFDVAGVDNGDGACDAGAFELTDDPVLTVTANRVPTDEVCPVDDTEERPVVGFTLANNGDDAVTVGGFSGTVESNSELPVGFTIAGIDLDVYQDDNGNGRIDSGENVVGNGSIDESGSTFEVDFDGGAGVSISANDSQSYLLVIPAGQTDGMASLIVPAANDGNGPRAMSLTAPLVAGGALLGLMGLVSVGGVRRRSQLLGVAAIVAVLLLAGCSDDEDADLRDRNDAGVNVDMDDVPLQGDFQFVVRTLDVADGSTADDLIIGDGLPVRGAALSLSDDDSCFADDIGMGGDSMSGESM